MAFSRRGRSTRRDWGRYANTKEAFKNQEKGGTAQSDHLSFQGVVLQAEEPVRTIALGANNTLEELHYAIQDAFDWDAGHLYSFFLSGQVWDRDAEFTLRDDELMLEYDLPKSRDTRRARIRDMGLKVGAKSLHLFDNGDHHAFAVEQIGTDEQVVKCGLPVVIDQRGRSPEQYPDIPLLGDCILQHPSSVGWFIP